MGAFPSLMSPGYSNDHVRMDTTRPNARRRRGGYHLRHEGLRARRGGHADAAARGAGSRGRDLAGRHPLPPAHGGPAPFAAPEHEGRFRSVSLFTGGAGPRGDRARPRRLRADLPLGHSRAVPVAAACRSTSRCCRSRRRTATATARWAPRSTRRSPPPQSAPLPDRRGQRADAAHARQHAGAAVADRTRSCAPTAAAIRIRHGRRRRSRTRSASTSPRWSRTAPRCRWASARSPTPCCAGSATSTTSASTPRCSPTASSTSSRPA